MKPFLSIFFCVIAIFFLFILSYFHIGIFTCDDLFQTTLFDKDIQFPIDINSASKKYDLKYESKNERAMSLSEKDTLIIADARGKSLQVSGIVFYLRELTINDFNVLSNSLENKYNRKFKNSIDKDFKFMQLNDCVYLMIAYSQFNTNFIFKKFSGKKIDCRVGFYYGLTENDVIFANGDGNVGIISDGYFK